MTQIARPTPAAADYDSTIIGALELSEKKWVLAVPESNGIRGMWWKLAATNWLRLSSDYGAKYQAGDSYPRSRARRVLVGAFSGSVRRRSPCNAAVEPSRGSAGATGKDGRASPERHPRRA
jgi:hypothetical protein